MFKKTSKYLVLLSTLLVFSFLLASWQSMIAINEELNRKRAIDAWGANLTAQGEKYLEDMESESFAYLQASGSLIELGSDVPSETAVMAQSFSPGIEIRRTRLQARTFLTVYSVMSDGPGWVVFHEDQDGVAGAILEYIWVKNGTTKITRTEVLEESSSEPIHVMLHHDFGWLGYFEYPRTDGPVFVDNEMVNQLCFCPF